MKLTCLHCGKFFEGNATKFCSQSCKDTHVSLLDRKLREAVTSDSGHTKNFSDN